MNSEDLLPGGGLGKYTLVRPLGTGGMGTVWEATDGTGGRWAVKFCIVPGEEATQRFAREVRAMKLIGHPNVVKIVSDNLESIPPYFVMPYSEAGVMEYCHEMGETARLEMFLEICAGVKALHGVGVLHRDIKPANMRIFDGRPAIADLGLARFIVRDTEVLTATKAVLGTEWYLAPEQKLPGGSREADARTDVYQLGRSLYQILTGSPPALMDLGGLAPLLRVIIERATREQPSERYQTVSNLMDAIDTYLATQASEATNHQALTACLSSIKDQARFGRFDPKEVRRAADLLLANDLYADKREWLRLFDEVPDKILALLPSLISDEILTEIIRRYRDALLVGVKGERFEYAERVVRRVQSLLSIPNLNPRLIAVSIECALISAVALNRFAAMDGVNSMLMAISDSTVAAAVAEMLSERPEYQVIADQVPTYKLHPIIAALRSVGG